MALFSNTLWGKGGGSTSQGSSLELLPTPSQQSLLLFSPDPQERYLTQCLALSVALLGPAETGAPIQDRPLVGSSGLPPEPLGGGG